MVVAGKGQRSNRKNNIETRDKSDLGGFGGGFIPENDQRPDGQCYHCQPCHRDMAASFLAEPEIGDRHKERYHKERDRTEFEDQPQSANED